MINVITRDDLTEPMGVGNYVLTYPEDTMNSKEFLNWLVHAHQSSLIDNSDFDVFTTSISMMLMIQDLDESIASKLNIFSCVNWYIAHEGKLRAVTAEEAILNVADLMDHDRFDVLRFDPKEMKELLKSDR